MNNPMLLGLNVLIALTWSSHIHHLLVHQWFAQAQKNGWATLLDNTKWVCPALIQPENSTASRFPKRGVAITGTITGLSNHLFWKDSIALTEAIVFQQTNIIGYRQITDAYLLSLAIYNKGHLVSFDKGIAALVPDSYKLEDT
jgi:predicted nucleic acid-binding protein